MAAAEIVFEAGPAADIVRVVNTLVADLEIAVVDIGKIAVTVAARYVDVESAEAAVALDRNSALVAAAAEWDQKCFPVDSNWWTGHFE
jgi:hypothetical protein